MRIFFLAAAAIIFLAGCGQIPTPALSGKERVALQKHTWRVQEKKAKVEARRRRARWLGSQGSNWPCPSLRAAKKLQTRYSESVAFAVRCRGGIRGVGKRMLFPSASSSKALLLLAFLREGGDWQGERQTLQAMIRYSDNAAADAIYGMLGDEPLLRTAEYLGMRDTQFVGYWSSVLFSPADYVRLWAALPRALPGASRRFAMRLFASITPEQRWGIPQGARGYRVYFKGGWRPESGGWLVVQGGLLRKRNVRLALAVFTLGLGQSEAEAAIEDTTRKILRVR